MKIRVKKRPIVFWSKLMLLLLIGIYHNYADAQGRTVTGIIKDVHGVTLPGVSIVLKGSTLGVLSDVEGNYSISVPASVANPRLVYSFIGFENKEELIGNRNTIDVSMIAEVNKLDEVVVVGYGTLDKREVTSSITSIKSSDLIPTLKSNPLMGIQDKVTGLNIVSSNGSDPNSTISMQLRGANSVKAGQGPLIVIDGIPGADIQSVAPSDVKSIDILKDASAAAIFGTRGSGGVILITTNQAKEGPVSLSYQGELMTETIRRRAEPLGPDAYLAADLGNDQGSRTDWFKEITHTPISHNHTVTLAGGSSTAKVYTSIYYRDLQGIVIGSNRKEIGGRINLNYSTFNGLADIITHSSYSQQTGNYVTNDVFRQAIQLNPTISPFDENDITGMNVWTGGWEYYNPLAEIKLKTDRKRYRYLLNDITLRLNLSKNFNTSAMLGYKNTSQHDILWKSAQHRDSRANKVDGMAKQETQEWNEFTFEWLNNWTKSFGKHNVKLLAGYSYQQFDKEGHWMQNENFPVDGTKWYDMGSGTFLSDGRAQMGSSRDPTEKIAAAFGRINYSFNDKFLLMASLRYEGSSKFSPQNRWGLFPALSAGWRITRDIKVRGGYGKTGNQDFGAGRYIRQYGADTWWLYNGKWIKTYGLDFNTNYNLKWETKTEINMGVDFAFFNNKVSGKVDVYRRKSDNLIYDISVAQPPSVHDKTTMNSGSLTNTGWEAEVSWNAISTQKFNYVTTLRASSNKNKLNSLWGSQTYWDMKGFPAPGSPGDAVRLYPGQDIGRFYIWKFAGFTDDGQWLLYDKDDNIIPADKKTNNDKRFIGNAIPRLILSWDHSVTWRNFDLNVFLRSWIDFDVYNMIEMYYGIPNIKQNVLKDTYEKNKHIKGEKQLSDFFVEDGTFLKLDAVTLGYRINVSKLSYVKNLRIYGTARNVLTITRYKGLDPEVNINGLEPGFEERDVYPKTRTLIVGLQIGF